MSEPVNAVNDSDVTAGQAIPRWRRILVSALAIVGCVLAPISIHAVWIHNTLLNTDQYVATVGPLASDPAVQNALANRVSNDLVDPVAIQRQLKANLPPKVSSVVGPFLVTGVQQLAHRVTLRVVQSPKFATLWEAVNRRAHTKVVALLKGQGRFAKNGAIVLDLGPIIDKASGALNKAGVTGLATKVSSANRQFVLFDSATLKDTQGGVRLLNTISIALPILTVLLLAAAVVLSRKRRRTILHTALGVALAMAVPLVLYALLRRVYVNALPRSVNADAAQAVYDQVLSFLRLALRSVFALAIVTALGAWLAGPGRVATRFRTRVRDLVRGAPGETWVRPSIAEFVNRNRNPLRVAALAIGFAILVFLSAPSPWAVLVIALLVLVALAVIELLARGATQPSETASQRS